MFWPSLVLAILAAIVASQATITACFQLLAQIMNSSYFPHIEMKYTSTTHHGQVYIPIANWLLMVGCVIVTAVYNNTTRLGHAYGVCVILVTFITTNLVALTAVIVWRLHPALVFAIWLPFVTLDGLYLSSAMVSAAPSPTSASFSPTTVVVELKTPLGHEPPTLCFSDGYKYTFVKDAVLPAALHFRDTNGRAPNQAMGIVGDSQMAAVLSAQWQRSEDKSISNINS